MQSSKLIVYPVNDRAQATALYRQILGVEPYVNEVYYVGFKAGEQEIGLDPNGHKKGMTGPIVYWQVDDVRQSLQACRDAGWQVAQEVTDVGGGKLIAWVKDSDGSVVGLMQ